MFLLVINHADSAVTLLNSISSVPVASIVVVPVTYSGLPTDPEIIAINNALARNASSIAALQQSLSNITVVGDEFCDGPCVTDLVC